MLCIAALFIWLSLGKLSYNERNNIWKTIKKSNKIWILVSMAIGVFSHWIRAVRWNFLLKPLGQKIPKTTSFASIMAGYFANLGIPRTGEVLRASLVHKKTKIPFQQLFGTIITERLVDMLMLIIITCISVIINTGLIITFFESNNINPLKLIIFLASIPLICFFLLKLFNKLKSNRFKKIIHFIKDLIESIVSIKKMPQKQYFIFLTVLIWLCYIAMFYAIKYSIDGTESMTLPMIIVTFVIGSFAMTISNGGLGAFPFSIASTLVFFGYKNTDSEAFGWILWSSQTIINIILGVLGLIYFAFFAKKNSILPHQEN